MTDRDHAYDQPVGPLALARELGLSLLVLALCLAAVELALRTETAYRLLPLARPYYSFDVTRRVHDLERLMQDRDRLDVLFVGSSVVRAAIDPRRFDAALKKQGHSKLTSFNGGLSTMYPTGAKLYLEHVWLGRAHPRFVLHGVREAELRSGQKRPSYLDHGRVEPLWRERTFLADAQAALLGELRLLQYRGTLHTVLTRMKNGTPWHIRERGERASDARGFRREKRPLSVSRRHGSKRLWKYGANKPRAGRYKISLPALEAMHALCKRAGATYVLVNMPEHPERFGKRYGQATFDDYHRRVRAWADAHGVPLLDVTDARLSAFADDRWYSDYHHLSPNGAQHFSDLLAARFAALLRGGRR